MTARGAPGTVVEVFADVCCPFTHVGLRRFVQRRDAAGRGDVRLRVRSWPLELVNGTPLDPAFVAEEVDELRAQVAPELFAGFDPTRFPASSLAAMALAAAAYRRSDDVGERVSLALRHAVFEDGRDVGDPTVVAEIAAAHDLPAAGPAEHDQVVADWHEGRDRGVVGSPHFFVAGQGWFCPGLDIARIDGRLRIRADRAGLDELFDSYLA